MASLPATPERAARGRSPGRSGWRRTRFAGEARVHAVALLVALVAQMLLPVAHAAELERVARSLPSADRALAEAARGGLAVEVAPPLAARHDAARCAVCCNAVHSGHALAHAATCGPSARRRVPGPAVPAETSATATERAHPPRAPPPPGSGSHPEL